MLDEDTSAELELGATEELLGSTALDELLCTAMLDEDTSAELGATEELLGSTALDELLCATTLDEDTSALDEDTTAELSPGEPPLLWGLLP